MPKDLQADPHSSPPPGHVAVADFADRAGCSYSTVYAACKEERVISCQPGGAGNPIYVLESELLAFRQYLDRPRPTQSKRCAVMVRVPEDRHAAWELAAERAGGYPVSSWLASLADRASGYNPR